MFYCLFCSSSHVASFHEPLALCLDQMSSMNFNVRICSNHSQNAFSFLPSTSPIIACTVGQEVTPSLQQVWDFQHLERTKFQHNKAILTPTKPEHLESDQKILHEFLKPSSLRKAFVAPSSWAFHEKYRPHGVRGEPKDAENRGLTKGSTWNPWKMWSWWWLESWEHPNTFPKPKFFSSSSHRPFTGL